MNTILDATTLPAILENTLTANYGTPDLNSGIQALIADSQRLVAAGFDKPHESKNTGLRVFASEAGGCSRAIALRMAGFGQQEPSQTLKTTFLIGDKLHAALQEGLLDVYPGFKVEEPWLWQHISGRADGLYIHPYKTVLEIKSCSKSSFSYALWKGPKANHILQASLSALVFGADHIHIVYICKEPVTKPKHLLGNADIPNPLQIMDWILPLNNDTAQEERERLTTIAKTLASRAIPDTETAFGYIDDPKLFKWPCSYCPVRDICAMLGPGEHPLPKLLELYPHHTLPDMTLAI